METTHRTGGQSKGKGHKTIIVPEAERVKEKWCSQCRKYRIVPDEWYENRRRDDGLGAQCKWCDTRNRTIRRQNANKRFIKNKNNKR